MKNGAKLMLCLLLSGAALGVCGIIAFGFAPGIAVKTEVIKGADFSNLFYNRPGGRLVSRSIKELIVRSSAVAQKFCDRGQYEKAAECLLDGEEQIQSELNRLTELAGVGKADDRKEARSAEALLMLYRNEDLAHAGECFLKAGLYAEAQTQFEKCIPYFRSNSLRGNWDHPTIHEAYKNYMLTLEKLKETDLLTAVRSEYQEVAKATASGK